MKTKTKTTQKRFRRLRYRRRSKIYIHKTITASSPFIQANVRLTSNQMAMLINGFHYIFPGQHRICSRKSINEIIVDQYQNILKVIKGCLNDHHIFASDARIKHAFPIFERLIHDIYSKPLPRRLQRRSKYEYRIIRSIRCLLRRRPDIVIRRTDKSKVFYVGNLEDFDRKAMEYMTKTEAYEEITNGRSPLADNYRAVKTVLDYLVSKNTLTKKQANKLLPNESKLELGHYHGLPKPHKVSLSFLIVFNLIFFLQSSLEHHYDQSLHRSMHHRRLSRNS